MKKIKLKNINDAIIKNENLVIVFSTEWCGQCKMAELLVNKIKGNYPNVVFVKMDVDDNDLWNDKIIEIQSVPTFIGYKNKNIIFNKEGYQNEDNLIKLLDLF